MSTRASSQKSARNAVTQAVKKGLKSSPKKLKCSDCGTRQADHYHHYEGYDLEHWLDVVPLCRWCHGDKQVRVGALTIHELEEMEPELRGRVAASLLRQLGG